MKDAIIKLLKNPQMILVELDRKGIIRLTDKNYLKILYKKMFNKKLNLANLQTFNEKLQWLKLYDRNPEYAKMVDKYETKKYVANVIGEEYIIPTLGIYDSFDEIDFEELPDKFVMKCTHDSGSTIVCKEKEKFDKKKAKNKINKCLRKNFYYEFREWTYKNVKPRIIIEKYMEDSELKELVDYKVYAFNGECDYLMACYDREKGNTKFFYYDRAWNLIKRFSNDGMKYGDSIKIPKPKELNKMFEFASILSKNIPFVRVDFYEANGKLYFGELTFYPNAGFETGRTKELDDYLDSKLKI